MVHMEEEIVNPFNLGESYQQVQNSQPRELQNIPTAYPLNGKTTI